MNMWGLFVYVVSIPIVSIMGLRVFISSVGCSVWLLRVCIRWLIALIVISIRWWSRSWWINIRVYWFCTWNDTIWRSIIIGRRNCSIGRLNRRFLWWNCSIGRLDRRFLWWNCSIW